MKEKERVVRAEHGTFHFVPRYSIQKNYAGVYAHAFEAGGRVNVKCRYGTDASPRSLKRPYTDDTSIGRL